MNEPKQPICKGTDEKGELVWGFIPMPRWQQAMFPVRYCGDFLGFWLKQIFYSKTGYEGDPQAPSMELRSRDYRKSKPRRPYSGD